MAGIQRLPALLFPVPNKNLVDINLQKYEILNNEPLHDISHHTQNLFDELPYHTSKEMKQTLKKVIHTSFNGKEVKNSADYKESLLIVGAWLIQNYPNHFITNIITTFAEIQEILYAPNSKRSIQSVFRLRNITFCHALLLKKYTYKGTLSQ